MNLSRNSTLVNTTSDDQESVAIALSSNVTYVVVGVVSIVVLLLALIPLTVDRKFMKKTILSQAFMISCVVHSLAVAYSGVFRLYVLKFLMRQPMTRYHCLYYGMFHFIYVFAHTTTALIMLLAALERFLAITRPLVYRTLTFRQYANAVVTLSCCALVKTLVILIFVLVDARHDCKPMSPLCLQYELFSYKVHIAHVYVLQLINISSLVTFATAILWSKWKLRALADQVLTVNHMRRELVIMKRLSIVMVNIFVLQLLPLLLHFAFVATSTLRWILPFLWIPYHVSLIASVLTYCVIQSDMRNIIFAFWPCTKRRSVSSQV